MPIFTYKARKADGESISGTLQAESERAALDTLSQQGVFPIEIRGRGENGRSQESEKKPQKKSWGGHRAPRADDVSIFTRQLADLLRAGVPLHRALLTAHKQTSNRVLAGAIEEIAKDVGAGKTLNEALARHRKIFSSLYLSMVKAGEAGGFLEDVLSRLAGFIEKDSELKSRIRSALAYPVLLIVLGTAAVIFLLAFFIPRFATIFEDMGGNLPTPTLIVMAVSDFLQTYWIVPLAAAILAIFAWKQLSATRAGRVAIDRVRIRLPLFGEVVKKNAIARFSRTLGTLLKSGVPILSALQIAKDALDNAILMEDIEEVIAGVRQGRGFGDVLAQSRAFLPMVSDMVSVGEESGNLDEVLLRVADSYDAQVDRAVRVFVSLFEPILLLAMACLVGFIVISMLLPVFTLSSMIK